MPDPNAPIDATLAARAADALPALVEIARLAGDIALADFRPGMLTPARVDTKAGGSPVTAADLAVDQFLRNICAEKFPGAGWLSEETADDLSRTSLRELIVADPIDGTRAFVVGDPRWCVAIGLIVDGRPVAGVVHAPALQTTYAASLGAGATRNGEKIFASSRAKLYGAKVGGPRGLVTTVSNLRRLDLETEPRIPSLAYRLARVAEGSLDAAIASVDSHDWDIAAGEILLVEAGAGVRDVHGHELIYNGAETRRGLLAAAPLKLLPALVDALGRAVRSRPR